jgi:biotin operon repressor
MDALISMMSTGTPDEFAERIGIRRSTLFQNIQEMKKFGVNIKYSTIRRSYYYVDEKRIRIRIGD